MKGKELKGTTTINLQGMVHELRFDMNSFCELEDRFGNINKAFEVLQNGSMKGIRTLLWAGLLHEDGEVTEKEVGEMVRIKDLTTIADKITEALNIALPEEKSSKEKN